MTDLRSRISGVVLNRLADYGIRIDRETADSVAASVLELPGIAITALPDAEEEWPGSCRIWLNGDVRSKPGRVAQYLDSRLEPEEARTVAAALLAAAVQAQEPK